MTEHTPGPYYVHLPRKVSGGCRTIRTEKGRMHGTYGGTEIATTHGLADDAVDAANARLLATAPDMLEALENIENDDQHMPSTAWDMIQAAIVKARRPR